MRAPYKVIVWGPGGLGILALREIVRLHAFELVGLRVYDPAKVGQDAGALAGVEATGVTGTDDVAALLAIDCDCVLYTARDFGTYTTDDEIVRILEAGRSVVTALPYQYAHIAGGQQLADQIEAACRKGSSSFHATGVNPVLIPDRVILALTGLTNDLKATRLQEFWDSTTTPAPTLKVVGFGESEEVARSSDAADAIAANFLKQGLYSWAEMLGVTYDRVETEQEFGLADRDIDIGTMVIRKGTVSRATRRWMGFVDAIGPQAFMTIELNWTIGLDQLPGDFRMAIGQQGYLISIEGSPSVRAFIEFRDDLGPQPKQGGSDAGYRAVVATMLQSVPATVRHAPGIMHSPLPAIHWVPDLRSLEAKG